MKKTTFFTLIILCVSCHPRQAVEAIEPDDVADFTPPKNIVLMIGSGMGITQITAGMYLNGNKLNLEEFKYIGLHSSEASDAIVTDIAAAATAIACGQKTYVGGIGVDKRGKSVQNILEEAEKKGMATGLVVTASITHATPASYYAHVKSKEMVEEIAADMLNVDIDFFVGGGKMYFDRRKDGRNLIKQLSQKGYAVSSFVEEAFSDIDIDPNKNFGYFVADKEPTTFAQGRDFLVPASRAAVDYLSKQPEKGFFLVVEGAQIDWGGRANDSQYIISEMIDFDNAIGAVLDFAKANGETLVIVTAGHETGGYAINPTSTMDSIVAAFTTDRPTATLTPVFALGPGEALFTGFYENTSIYEKMRQVLRFRFPLNEN